LKARKKLLNPKNANIAVRSMSLLTKNLGRKKVTIIDVVIRRKRSAG
jgi:hypothetical protein|tara:strand:- start:164 stop:304 length:141 start_codon:yes stop_codon:yes gene_type:complete